MSTDFNQRYSRQIILPEIGTVGQQRIAMAQVLVISACGLGCPVVQYLVAAGVQHLTVVDNDTVSSSNLHRQILYSTADVGKKKIQILKHHFAADHFKFVDDEINNTNVLHYISQCDVVVDTTDNFATRYLVNDACVLLGKPLVSASVQKFNGQLSVFNYLLSDGGRSGTYRCLFPEMPATALNCDTAGVMGTAAGVMGTLQANEVIKVITQAGNVLANQLLLVDLLTMKFNSISFTRDENAVNTLLKNGITEQPHLEYESDFRVNEISVEDLNNKLSSGESLQLIDVREDFEHEEYNIGGMNIPLNEIIKQQNKIDRHQPVVLYCKIGERSFIAAQRMNEKYGLTNLYNLKGGVTAWKKMKQSPTE